jgi:hypothetical protein
MNSSLMVGRRRGFPAFRFAHGAPAEGAWSGISGESDARKTEMVAYSIGIVEMETAEFRERRSRPFPLARKPAWRSVAPKALRKGPYLSP